MVILILQLTERAVMMRTVDDGGVYARFPY